MGGFVQTRESAMRYLEWARPLIAEALKYQWSSIVDFGCGYGLHTAEFARAGRHAVGMDVEFSTQALYEAQSGGYALLTRDQIEEDGHVPFDAGYSHHCLEHLPNAIETLNGWAGIIKPGGMLFLSVPDNAGNKICAGHVHAGWSVPQLAYILAVAGWDCSQGRFKRNNGSVFAIVSRPESVSIADTHVDGWGEAADRMPEILKRAGGNVLIYNGNDINWGSRESGI